MSKLTRRRPWRQALLAVVASICAAHMASAENQPALDRSVLPIQPPAVPEITELDVRDATMPETFTVAAPEGAPNVVVVLIDDLGFGATSTFGGPINTPSLDALASEGLRFTSFHTTALCSPTRAALKSGRNHHVTSMGYITEMATGFPGSTGQIPNTVAPLAEILRLNGFSTAAFGKWHETAAWETSVSGPFDRWPTHQGFDKFYGFIGGETNHWAPFITDGVAHVEPPEDPDYNFMTDITDQSITWIRHQQAMMPDKPFFVYFAPGAVHAPHHVPQDWIDRWKGKFDQGWDVLREQTLARQIEAGLVPPDTVLAPKPAAIRDWDSLSDDEKTLFARQAEVFAAFTEYADHEIGRMIKAIDDMGELDNTLVFYIAGDNGTSAEGGENGMFNEYTYFNGVAERVSDMLPLIDKWGGPETYPHMSAGWAVALNAPFTWVKQVASSFGGTRVGMAVHWPKGIEAQGEIRTQFGHVIDVAPTILEAVGLPEPTSVNGTPQIPLDGLSLLYAFDDAEAPERRTTQYFEIAGNRAIYHDGWLAGTIHKAPWEAQPRGSLEDDVWELYDVRADFSLSRDLAAEQPGKLAEMQALFLEEARANNVLPIDDRTFERLTDPVGVGRPDIFAARDTITLAQGMTGMLEAAFPNVKNRSLSIEADILVPEGGASGTIIAQGGRFGGWSLYLKDGVPGYSYNYLGLQTFDIVGTEALASGEAGIRLEFAYDGGGPGRGGLATLLVNGEAVAEGRIERTQAAIFSADETADVGVDLGTAVVAAVGAGAESTFTGGIPRVALTLQ
jgi:arylsulfatase A-like enzyme